MPDQRELYMSATGKHGGARQQPAPQGAKQARRAAAAAAAAELLTLPAATKDFEDAYPAVKKLLQRFK